jgi:nicotinamide-nucleotide amidase
VISAEFLGVSPDPAPGVEAGVAAIGLARLLESRGITIRGHRVVGTDEAAVLQALSEAVSGRGLVVCLAEGPGGEVLRGALARLLGTRLVLSDRALDALTAAYGERGQAMPRRAEGLALVPQGATVLVPAGGGEPGLLVEASGVPVVVLPGVAAVAAAIVREHVLPRLLPPVPGVVTVTRTLRLVGVEAAAADTALGEALRGVEDVTGRASESGGETQIRLAARGPSIADAEARLRAAESALRAPFATTWYGADDETLEAVVGRLLRARGLTVALAESCTGGLVGHRLTQVPGSSAYFERGVVVYSNAAKRALTGVPEAVLAEHGAVSAPCAEAMARGVRERAGTDLGVSVTGIAGPEGGTPTKPVGLVFVGVADRAGAVSHRFRFDRDRAGNKVLAAAMALDLIRRYCLDRA